MAEGDLAAEEPHDRAAPIESAKKSMTRRGLVRIVLSVLTASAISAFGIWFQLAILFQVLGDYKPPALAEINREGLSQYEVAATADIQAVAGEQNQALRAGRLVTEEQQLALASARLASVGVSYSRIAAVLAVLAVMSAVVLGTIATALGLAATVFK